MSRKRISKFLFISVAGLLLLTGYLLYRDFNSFKYAVPELDELLTYQTHGFKISKNSSDSTTRYVITARNSCDDSAEHRTFSLTPQFAFDQKNSLDPFPVEYRIESDVTPSSYFKQDVSDGSKLSCVSDNIELTLNYGIDGGVWPMLKEYIFQRVYRRPKAWKVTSWSVKSYSEITQCLQQSEDRELLSVAEQRFLDLYRLKNQASDLKYFSGMFFNHINDSTELSVRGQSYAGNSVFTVPMSAYLLYELTEDQQYFEMFKESVSELTFELTDEQIDCMQRFNRDSFVGCAVDWNIDIAKQESPFPVCEVPLIAQNLQYQGLVANDINISPLLFICNEISKVKSAYAQEQMLTFDTDFAQLYTSISDDSTEQFEITESELTAVNFPRSTIDYYANAMLSGGHYMQVIGDIRTFGIMKNYYNQCASGIYSGSPVDYLALKRALFYRYLSTYQTDSPKEHILFTSVCDIPESASESVRTGLLYESGFETWYWDSGFVSDKSIFSDLAEVDSFQSALTSSCSRYTVAESSVIQEFSDIYYLLMLAALQESL